MASLILFFPSFVLLFSTQTLVLFIFNSFK